MQYQTDLELVFDMISSYIHRTEDVIEYAQLCHASFDVVYYNHRQRNRVLQHYLTTLNSHVMRNEYYFKQHALLYNQLLLDIKPKKIVCVHQFTKGPRKFMLCKKEFVASPVGVNGPETKCMAHRDTKASSTYKPIQPNARKFTELANKKREMSELDDAYDVLTCRVENIRNARAKLSSVCFRQLV